MTTVVVAAFLCALGTHVALAIQIGRTNVARGVFALVVPPVAIYWGLKCGAARLATACGAAVLVYAFGVAYFAHTNAPKAEAFEAR